MARREIKTYRFVAFALAFALFQMTAVSHAQMTLDHGIDPTGALSGPNCVILSTVGQTRDGNLFHSFGLFNVLTGQSALLIGPSASCV